MASEPHSDLIATNTSIGQYKDMYMTNTHFLNDYNEVYNTNDYLDKTTNMEGQRLEGVYDRLRSTVLRLKQEMLLKKFNVEDFKMKNNIMAAAIALVSFMLIMLISYSKDKVGPNLLTMITLSLSSVFILIVYVIVKNNSYRVETNWNQYYWGPIEKKR
jgi:hypothetical protein